MSGTVVCCFSSGLLIGVKCEYANTVALTYDAGGHSAALPQPKLRKVVSVFVRLVVF